MRVIIVNYQERQKQKGSVSQQKHEQKISIALRAPWKAQCRVMFSGTINRAHLTFIATLSQHNVFRNVESLGEALLSTSVSQNFIDKTWLLVKTCSNTQHYLPCTILYSIQDTLNAPEFRKYTNLFDIIFAEKFRNISAQKFGKVLKVSGTH